MRSDFDPDRLISDWLDDTAPSRAPDDLLDQVLATTGTARRRPGWVIPERWLPMKLFLRPQAYTRLAAVALLLILATLLAVAGVVGSQLDREPAPPFGLARNGLVAFDANGDIWVADPDGSNPRALTSGPGVDIDPTWSPDGTLLAYWSLNDPSAQSDGVVTQDHVIGLVGESTASLMVTDDEGRPATVLLEGITLDPNGLPPSWSPDSEQLVFAHLEDGTSVIDVVDLDGSSTRVTDGESPSWSPDGSEIAFRLPDVGVMVVGVDGGGEPRQVSNRSGSGYAFSLPQWSPDGSMITFYAGADGTHDIWVVNADGTDEHFVSNDIQDEYWPYWSPDGSRIAYGRTGRGETLNVGNFVVADLPSGVSTVLPVGSVGAGAPTTWSPDGTMLIGGLVKDGVPTETWPVLIDASGAEPALRSRIDGPASVWNSFSWQRLAP
jgi:TolB protein